MPRSQKITSVDLILVDLVFIDLRSRSDVFISPERRVLAREPGNIGIKDGLQWRQTRAKVIRSRVIMMNEDEKLVRGWLVEV